MKTQMKTQVALIAAALALVGCASQKQDPASTVSTAGCSAYCETVIDANGDGIADVPTGTGTTPATTGYATGSTASIVLNGSALGRLFYNSQPVNPTNVRINVNMASVAKAITISYVENGVLKEAVFGTKHPDNSYSNSQYNGWVVQDGVNVWKGYFQDAFGAIVIVIDKNLAQGDGTAATILGGSIFFQNFKESAYQNPIQGPQKMCWEITAGPYECRTFMINQTSALYSGTIQMNSSLYPNNKGKNKTLGYEKLGEFAGISRSASGF